MPIPNKHEKEVTVPCQKPKLKKPAPTIRDALAVARERLDALDECDCRMVIVRGEELPKECLVENR